MYDLTTSTLQDILHGQKFTIKFITVHTNPPRKPPKSIWRAKYGLVAYLFYEEFDGHHDRKNFREFLAPPQ